MLANICSIDFNLRDDERTTVLSKTVEVGSFESVRFLLDHRSANPEIAANERRTPRHSSIVYAKMVILI